jgi:hypothetical protein
MGRAEFGRISDEVADGDEPGSDPYSDPAHQANGIAFLLVSAACLMLADAHLRRTGAAGFATMDEMEDRIEEALKSLIAEHSFEDAPMTSYCVRLKRCGLCLTQRARRPRAPFNDANLARSRSAAASPPLCVIVPDSAMPLLHGLGGSGMEVDRANVR